MPQERLPGCPFPVCGCVNRKPEDMLDAIDGLLFATALLGLFGQFGRARVAETLKGQDFPGPLVIIVAEPAEAKPASAGIDEFLRLLDKPLEPHEPEDAGYVDWPGDPKLARDAHFGHPERGELIAA